MNELILALLVAAIDYTLHAKDVFLLPEPPAGADWADKSVSARDAVEFRARGGSQIRGWLYKAEEPDAAYVLFFCPS